MSLATRAIAVSGALIAARALLRQQRRIEFSNRVVVISGGSRGLGLEIARRFAAEGAHLALLARNRGQLESARQELRSRSTEVLLVPCDVRNESEAVESIRTVAGWKDRIDVLVNNAGIIQVGPYEHMNRDDFVNALEVHFWGPLRLIEAALPYMRRQGEGRIVNIASFGGKIAVPHLLPYCASKFALVGLSDGFRAELAHGGIYVTTVCPGLMRTGSHVNAWFKGRREEEFALFSITNALPTFSMSSSRAARRIVEACRYAQPFLMMPSQARAAHIASTLFPNLVANVLEVAGRLLPRPAAGGDPAKPGWECRSPLAPRWLTYLSDAATRRNNELPSPGRSPRMSAPSAPGSQDR